MHLRSHPLPASSVAPLHTLHTHQETESQKESSRLVAPSWAASSRTWLPGPASPPSCLPGLGRQLTRHMLSAPCGDSSTLSKLSNNVPARFLQESKASLPNAKHPLKTIAPGPASPSRAHRLCSATYRRKPGHPSPIAGRASEGGCPSLGLTPGISHLQIRQPLAQGPGEEARWAGVGCQARQAQGRFRGLPVSRPLAARVAGSTGSSYQIRPGPQCLDRLKLLQSGGRQRACRVTSSSSSTEPAGPAERCPRGPGSPTSRSPGGLFSIPGRGASVENRWNVPCGTFGKLHLESEINQGAERSLELLRWPREPQTKPKG